MSAKSQKKNKQNKVIYAIINITENTKEKDCISADKKNEKKYRETIEKLGVTSKEWENTGVMLNMEIPPPPQPSNYEKLLEYRRTHVLRPAIIQSEATIYLHDRGYQLGIDYQAYQAIEIVNKLKEYEITNNLPAVSTPENYKDIRHNNYMEELPVSLDVLNYSNTIDKKRHSINLPPTSNSPNSPPVKTKNKRFGSFTYGSKKESNSKNNSKTLVKTIADDIDRNLNRNINHNLKKSKSKVPSEYKKTIRKKPPSKSIPIDNHFSNPSFAVENQYRRTHQFNHFGVMPSAPPMPGIPTAYPIQTEPSAPPVPGNHIPNHMHHNMNSNMPPDYNYNPQQTELNSSVDSLFDAEEIKQFEKNPMLHNQNNLNYNGPPPHKYPGIYPSLHGESDSDDVCSI